MEIKSGNKAKQSLKDEDFRTAESWDNMIKDSKNSFILRVLLEIKVSFEEINEEATKLKPCPYGMYRERKQKKCLDNGLFTQRS